MTGVRLRSACRVEQPGVQTTALLSAGRGEAGGSGPQARRSLATHWATRSPGGELIEQSFFPETPDQSHEYRRGAAGRGAVASDALLRSALPTCVAADGRAGDKRTGLLRRPRFPRIWLFLRASEANAVPGHTED